MEHAKKRLSAVAEVLRVTSEPFQKLYETLSADQRAALDSSLPMPPRPPM
jgi:hypothetical protein